MPWPGADQPRVVLFDVDGTIVESGQGITDEMACKISELRTYCEVGVVGGGSLDRLLSQLGQVYFRYYFTECGCLYYENLSPTGLDLKEVCRRDIRQHHLYAGINLLIRCALRYLSEVDYTVTGHFIDLRCGIVYVSLIGMVATQRERAYFMGLDRNHVAALMRQLRVRARELGITDKVAIVTGGRVGIAIYPNEWDKVQVVDYLPDRNICYFGDRYEVDGNDYKLLNHPRVKGFTVNSPEDTLRLLDQLIGTLKEQADAKSIERPSEEGKQGSGQATVDGA